MSFYKGELTLSSNLYGNKGDRDRIEAFIEDIITELPEATSGYQLYSQG